MFVSSASAVHLQACGRYLPLMLANERPKWSYYSNSHSAHYTSGRSTAKWRPWLFWEQRGSLLNVPHPSLQHESESFFFSSSAVTTSINSINCLLFPFWPQNGQKVLIRGGSDLHNWNKVQELDFLTSSIHAGPCSVSHVLHAKKFTRHKLHCKI